MSPIIDGARSGPDPGGRGPPLQRDAPGMLHRLLRTATRMDHANLDRMMLRIDLAARQDYGIFLQAHRGVLNTLKACWREEDRQDFCAMLRAVEQDSQTLGIAATPTAIPTGAMVHTPLLPRHQWGIAYVLRGSRLGARFLRRDVPSSLPTAYLDFMPTLTWPRFLEQLELRAEQPGHATPVEAIGDDFCGDSFCGDSIRGARAAFEIFTSVFAHALAGKP